MSLRIPRPTCANGARIGVATNRAAQVFVDGVLLRRGRAVVRVSAAFARAFGAMTVAGYVEDESIADGLREMGVDCIQGCLVSPPPPIEEAFGTAA